MVLCTVEEMESFLWALSSLTHMYLCSGERMPCHSISMHRKGDIKSTLSSSHLIGRKANVYKQGEELHAPRET